MSSKSGNGFIRQMEKNKPRNKCRKWQIRVSLGFDAYTGTYPEKTKIIHGTYSEAQRALRDFIEEAESGSLVKADSVSLEDYTKLYFELREEAGIVAPGSIRRDRDKLASLNYLIGKIKLQKLTPLVIEKAYLDLRSGKSKSGKNLSGTYVNEINKVLSCMLKNAVAKGVIPYNPCDKVTPPKIDTKERRALSAEVVKDVMDKLDLTHHGQCGILLCLTLGLRRGEVAGLSWDDISFEDRTVVVRHSYDDQGNLNVPKTKSSKRMLPMPDIVYDALQARKAFLIESFTKRAPELLCFGKDGEVVGFKEQTAIICDNFGVRIKPNGFDQWWRKHRSLFGLEGWTLHELRHTFLTLAAKQGVHPSVMQHLAGHSNARVTMEIYTHVNLDAKRDAMKALEQIF